ncbi:Acg family FMN-binding oxidoreductase [Paenibacillus sp. NPDC057967]|uniref:Acg family FMN-binding oxidoreductase n=1 Tax=Paenibacillus sp. NPDC057967 TaxID=3346293 RepID=UPI0036DE21C2
MDPKETTAQPQVSRRTFLKAALAGAVVVSGGTVWKAIDQGVFSAGKGPAYEAWRDWDSAMEEAPHPMPLIKAAILAANAHNAQPWLFRITDDAIDLFADVSRNLGSMDPMLREMDISLGCALENLTLSARANGYTPEVILMSGEHDQIHVARIVLTPGEKSISDLYRAIPSRHTDRSAFQQKAELPPNLLTSLQGLIHPDEKVTLAWLQDEPLRSTMGDIIISATEAIISDAEQSRDSHRWYRHDREVLHAMKDGTTLDATGSPPLTRALGKLFPVSESTSNQYWLKSTRDTQVPTAGAFACLLIPNRDRSSLIKAGRVFQRMHLWAAANGWAIQPMNQPNERIDREQAMNLAPSFRQAMEKLIPLPGLHNIFTFRIGYPANDPMPSPRRPAEDVLWKSYI